MPSIKKVGTQVQLEVERLDGGWNTKDAPNRISLFESPDTRNCVADDLGAISTRDGTEWLNSSTALGTNVVDGGISYNGSNLVWSGGSMYYQDAASSFTLVTASSGKFASGVNVAAEVSQKILFCSEGTNGPWRYEGPNDFYNMGIDTPSACTSSGSSAGSIQTGTYFYKIAFVNSHVVGGEVGSACTGVAITTTSTIGLEGIPVGSALAGVAKREVYRSNSGVSGIYKYVDEISDNTATSYADTITDAALGSEPPIDATSPTPFTTVKLHKQRLFFDDSNDRTLLRYTKFETPFISQSLNLIPLNKGDGSNILAIGVQDDFVCTFKDKSIWITGIVDSSDDTAWQTIESPSNYGIIGPRAFVEIEGGIMFAGKRAGKITGFHLLQGINVAETADNKLRTKSISEKIENTIKKWPATLTSSISMELFDEQVYISVPNLSSSTEVDGILYFDVARLGDKGQPGSWFPWDGITVHNLWVHEGVLYGGDSTANGRVITFNADQYKDADGSAINSYYWTGEIGGEAAIESWIKDWRKINLWYERLGAWSMDLSYRLDGDKGVGVIIPIDLSPTTATWNNVVWGSFDWSAGQGAKETQHSLGSALGRRIQFKFSNQNTVGQAFKVYSDKLLMNLRRQLG